MILSEKQYERLKNNIDSLIDKQLLLANKITDYIKEINEITNVKMVKTKTEETALEFDYNSSVYKLNSIYDPVEEGKRWSEQFKDISDKSIVIIWGFGNGIIAREVMQHGKEVCFLFIEPSKDIFAYTMLNYDISDILKNKKVFVVVEGMNDLDKDILLGQFLNWYNLSLFKETSLPKYNKLYVNEYKKLLQKLKDENEMIKINKATEVFFSSIKAKNQIKNYAEYINGSSIDNCIDLVPSNIPGIIISAGPSLKNNIEVLKKWKGHAFILAVDTALSFLMKNDFIPDAWITIDGLKPESMFEDNRIFDLPAFFYSDSRFEIVNKSKNSKIFCASTPDFISEFSRQHKKPFSTIMSGGSVATSALGVLYFLGIRTIILTGQDLAYTGSSYYDDKEYVILHGNKYKVLDVESIDGKKLKTTEDYYHYLKWFEDVTKIDDLNLIDATEGGALIKGTTIISLQEAYDKYATNKTNISEILSNVPKIYNQKQRARLLLDWSIKIKNNINKIITLAITGYELCEKLLEEIENNNTRGMKELIKENHLINSKLESFPEFMLITAYMAHVDVVTTSNLYKTRNDSVLDCKINCMKLRFYYNAIEYSANNVLCYLD